MNRKYKGFILVEVIVSISIFALFAVGIYSGIQYVFKTVYQSRLRIIETGVLNEQMEIVRNMPFASIGIVNGSPAGVLTRTATTSRNGIELLITRTIRSIDDPFDGVIGGAPNDLAPTDYKLVELEVICEKCNQQAPARISSYIAPKNLEGDSNHGALFIEVRDSNAEPVQGATVHVVATTVNPTLDLTDTTNNLGQLNIVDLATGTSAYHITVSKDGFISDGTMTPTVDVSNPTKPHASVVKQDVTQRNFEIDAVSSLSIETINSQCVPVGNVTLGFMGTKLLGINPDYFKINRSIVTDGSGINLQSGLEWDSYDFSISGYDLKGSIPPMPIILPAGVDQPVKIIIGANTANSLVVNVEDSITGQPISNAEVTVSAGAYSETKTTGVGHVRQTDWSGGDGQADFTNEIMYWTDDGGIETLDPSGDVKLKKTGQTYQSSGVLESSTFDLGVSASYINLLWESLSQPPETGNDSVRWQIATADSSSPASWNFLGPDGTSGTYYDSTNMAINEIHNGDRYFRYKLYLQTEDTNFTPTVSDLRLTYTNSCLPPGQSYFGGLDVLDYTVSVSRTGYQTMNDAISLSGDEIFGIRLIGE